MGGVKTCAMALLPLSNHLGLYVLFSLPDTSTTSTTGFFNNGTTNSTTVVIEASPLTESSIIGLACLGGIIFLVGFCALCCYFCRKHRFKRFRQKLEEKRDKRQQVQNTIVSHNNDYRNKNIPQPTIENQKPNMISGQTAVRTQKWTSWSSRQPPSNADLRPVSKSPPRSPRVVTSGRYLLSVPSRTIKPQQQETVIVNRRPPPAGTQILVETSSGSGKQYATESGYTRKHVLPKRPVSVTKRYVYSAPTVKQPPPVQPTILTQSRRGVAYMVSNKHPIQQDVPTQQFQTGETRYMLTNYTPKVLQGQTHAQYTWSGASPYSSHTTHQWLEIADRGNVSTSYQHEQRWRTDELDEGGQTLVFEEEGYPDAVEEPADLHQVNTERISTQVQSHLIQDTEEIMIVDFVDDQEYITTEKDDLPLSTSTPRTPDQALATLDDVLDSESDDSGLSTEFRHKRQRRPHEGSLERLPGGRRRSIE